MSKQILFNEEARAKLKAGVDKLANAVKTTLGPRGRNVAIDNGINAPQIINDGVSIAKEITLKDKFENLGAKLVIEAATKTNDLAGDGTTTATVLTQSIISEGLKNITAGSSPVLIRSGIEKTVNYLVDHIKNIATKIETKEQISQVASISANSKEIGNIIAEAIEKVGNDGIVTVENSNTFGISSELVEGMQFDEGYVSSYMATNSEKLTAELNNIAIIITDNRITNMKQILPLIEKFSTTGSKELVIIADDYEAEVTATFIVNKMKGNFKIVAIKAPGYGEAKLQLLEDIAVLTGGKVISNSNGTKLETADVNFIGSAEKLIVKKNETIIVKGKGTAESIQERIGAIKTLIENTEADWMKEVYRERLAKLTGGVAIIKVGASTETEARDIKLRIEDAINATKAALRLGIVEGGGCCLLKATKNIPVLENKEEQIGADILKRALEAPAKQIILNAGLSADSITEKIKESEVAYFGFNALTNEFGNMLDMGIVDPAEVTITALKNAASSATMLLTTEVSIVEEDEIKPIAQI